MAFTKGSRVRLFGGAAGSNRTGTVVLVSAPAQGRGRTTYAVRWDGSPTTVPGYRDKELEEIR